MHGISELVSHGLRSESRARGASSWWRRAAAHAVPMLLLLVARTASAAPPANDNFADATVVPGLPFTDTENTVEATREVNEPRPICLESNTNNNTVWYSFTPDADVDVQVDTVGSDYDTTLTVYTGSFPSLTEIACNDDFAFPDRRSSLTFSAVAGETYFIMVGAFNDTGGGNLVFNMQEFIELGITLDATGTLNLATGQATVTGTVFCSSSTTVDVTGSVGQKLKGSPFADTFDTQVACVEGPDGTPWSAVTDLGGLKSGKANVEAFASVGGAFTVEASRSIKLQRPH